MIIQASDIYNGHFQREKFAYKFFNEENKLYPLGNIVSFLAGVCINNGDDVITSNMAINFCIEVPNTNKFTGACLHRLFNSGIANILVSNYLKQSIEVEGSRLVIKESFEQDGIIVPEGVLSFGEINQVEDSCMIYTGIHMDAGPSAPGATFSLRLPEAQAVDMMKKTNAMFYGLMNDLFISSRM